MKITKLDLWHINIPLKKVFYPSWIPGYPQSHNRMTLLQLTTNTGHKGTAMGMAFGKEREGIGDLLAPYLIGADATNIGDIHHKITCASYLGWHNYWMEAACYDLIAQEKGIPVWKLLEGKNDKIPVYWSTGEMCNPKHHSEIVKRAQKEGYHGVKLRVHSPTLQEDIDAIKKTRDLVDPQFPLMIDANQGWPVHIVKKLPQWDLERALKFTEGVADCNIKWIEEPLEMWDYEDLAELRRRSPIKISGCELNQGWKEAKVLLKNESLDIYQPDSIFFGFVDTLKLIKEIKKRNLIYTPHTWSNGLGLWINMHLYTLTDRSVPLEFPFEPDSWIPEFRDAILKKPIMPENGFLQLTDEPGLGIPIDWDKVKKYGEHFFSMSESGLAKKVIKEKGLWETIKLKMKKE